MKQFRQRGIIGISLIILVLMAGLSIIGCNTPDGPTPPDGEDQDPIATDFDISNTTQNAGSVTAVTITPKAGKSTGTITIYYDSKTEIPKTAGTYTVTFDVEASPGWNKATGLSAGTLTVNTAGGQTPAVTDYDIDKLNQTVGSVTAVTITPKSGKSSGARTIYYAGISPTTYAKSTTLPTAAGSYAVTFDVAAAAGWNAATGLNAGTLTINTAGGQTPVADDFTVSANLTQTAGSVTAVTVTPKSGKSTGAVTVLYNNLATLPQTAGAYGVTFNVAAATGWNAATSLYAGVLNVNNQTPAVADYDIGNLAQNAGNVTAVTITPKAGKSTGARTIYYEGKSPTTYAKSETVPTGVGTYTVTFDVAAVDYWNAATGLPAGDLAVTNQTPVAADYIIGNLLQKAGDASAVTITPLTGKSTGTQKIYYEGKSPTTFAKSETVPTAAGTYTVTFDVAATTGWSAAPGLSAGELVLNNNSTPKTNDYTIGNLTQTVGNVTAVTVTKKTTAAGGQEPPGAVTVKYNGATKTADELKALAVGSYTVTFDVAAATGWNAVTGLPAGTLTVQQNVNKNAFVTVWLDASNNVQVTSNNNTIPPTGTATITAGSGFTVVGWYVNGVSVNSQANPYVFSSGGGTGTYTISVAVSKDGKLYDAAIPIEVK
jgi:gas vesicle protein